MNTKLISNLKRTPSGIATVIGCNLPDLGIDHHHLKNLLKQIREHVAEHEKIHTMSN